jgi:D-3-phosphoglycerate dehydrogenase / 2-oxoglutarate reductase
VKMPLVVITDSNFGSIDIERAILEPLGLTVECHQCRRQAETIKVVAKADYIITQYAPIDESVIEMLLPPRLIVRYGIGYDNIDVYAARRRGIPVCNVPDYCINEVADHTMSLLLAATRQVVANASYVRKGNWGLGVPICRLLSLHGRTVGIVGFGRIGRAVAARLLSFGCDVVVHDPGVTERAIRDAGCSPAKIETLLEKSDIVTLHCPANRQTHHLISKKSIEAMKPGAILINVSRGALVSTPDLIMALDSGRISFAALDVLEVEPMESNNRLREMDNVIVHGHVAAFALSAIERLRGEAAETVAQVHLGCAPRNVVNHLDLVDDRLTLFPRFAPAAVSKS